MTIQPHEEGISISTLMERLKLSRNYITRNITHCVRHLEASPAQGARVLFDAGMLRSYLVNMAQFTRQTKRININCELEKYLTANPDIKKDSVDMTEFLGNIPDMKAIKRSKLPAVTLNPFDFWDLPLIFPKEYTQGNEASDAPIKTTECCYRDMFRAGAIKIQLGTQKTMFYIPSAPNVADIPLQMLLQTPVNLEDNYLVPADWEPFYQGASAPKARVLDLPTVNIKIRGELDEYNWQYIDSALRKVFMVDKIQSRRADERRGFVSITYKARIPHPRQ